MYNYVWYFLLFSFLGWCLEVGFHAVKSGRFVNRGFISGPACPIYGIGVSLAGLILAPIKNIFLLFLASTFICTVVELIVGFAMDKVFSSRWWDYSGEKFNLFGYVCLKFSIVWGLLCTVSVKLLDLLDRIIEHMRHPACYTVAISLLLLILFDAIMTSIKVFELNYRLKLLWKMADDVTLTLSVGSDLIGTGVYEGTVKLYSEYKRLLVQTAKIGMRIVNAFPTFKSKRYNEQLKVIRDRLDKISKSARAREK